MKLKKLVYVSGALLIGIIVCMSVWLFLREHKERELAGHKKLIPPNIGIAPDSGSAQKPTYLSDGNQGEELLTSEEGIARASKSNFKSLYSEEEFAASPRRKQILEAMNSPEFLELTKEARKTGPTMRKWYEFLESQGIEVDWEMLNNPFHSHFPGGPEDYEPEMRLKMAKLFLSTEPADLTDPTAAALQRHQVFNEFRREDKRNGLWQRAQFGVDWDGVLQIDREGMENNPAFAWITDVQRNAASIVAAAETTEGDTPEAQASAPSWDMSSVLENPSAALSETEIPATFDTSERAPMTDTEIETAIEKSLTPQPPDTPSEIQSNFENSLKAQFSSERFEQAMSTLDQYGPEEGLRRLKENDPEVAKQIERHRTRSLPRSIGEGSDKSEEEIEQ